MKEVFNHQSNNSSSSEPVGQNLIKLISNVCFSVFVFTVVIFTVIAITYQPPDPWLESAPALTRMFTQSENATFSVDNSMLKTGEDLDTLLPPPPAELPSVPPVAKAEAEQLPPPPSPPDQESVAPPPLVHAVLSPPAMAPAGHSAVSVAITPSMVPVGSPARAVRSPIVMAPVGSPVGAVSPKSAAVMIEKKDGKAANMTPRLECEDMKVVNCSDPRVLVTVRRFNSRVFKSIVFLEFGIPVNGSKPDECDVAWKFRNRKEKSWRKYRDFRRFRFGIGKNCTFKVIHAGRWHSGVNARSPRSRVNSTSSNVNPKAAPPVRDAEINDTIPRIGSPVNFRKGRYLYYSRGGDYCKGMNQYIWSFLCGLGEAMYLNRTFVMDLSMCLPASYNTNNKNEEGKDFRFYFDFEHLKEAASIAEKGEFLRDWKKWDRSHKNKVPVRKVMSHKVTPMQLKKDKSTIIWRQFNRPEPENYWHRVCEGPASKYIQRPWRAVWKSKRLMNIVTEISGRMDWDFDAVHVVRGEKAQNKVRWPHLDADTSPDALLQKLKGMVQPWRNVYVATNEPYYNYFDKLRSQYKVHLLEDYKELWGNKSEWYNETTLLNNGRPVEFDGYMRVAVDTEVFYRGKTRVETFYNLTKDCKDGINTC